METNYYRIPRAGEVTLRKTQLMKRVNDMQVTPENIESGFRFIKGDGFDMLSPWDEFMDDIAIHLGKRSSGWKFLWNFNDNEHYTTKSELFEYIRQGRVVNEYGEEIEVEEFITMALNWGQPNGMSFAGNKQIKGDRLISGLRVSSSTKFS